MKAGLLIVLLLMLLQPAMVQAQAQAADGLRVTTEIGFGGYYKVGEWFPIRVALTNDGPLRRGVLTLEGSTYAPVALPVELPSQSQQVYTLYTASRRLNSSATLYFRDGSTVFYKEDLRLKYLENPAFMLGVVGENAGLEVLNGTNFGYQSSRPDELNRNIPTSVVPLDLDDIPTNPLALNSLDALVIVNADTARLSLEQVAAVRGWVVAGGDLIVGGGQNGRTNAAAFADILPVEVGEAQSFDRLANLSQFVLTSEAISSKDTVAISAVTLKPGVRDTAGFGPQTFLARRAFGRGHVTFFAFDPSLSALRAWNGYDELWAAYLLPEHRSGPTTAALSLSGLTDNGGFALPQVQLPNPSLLAILLLVYIAVIGPLNFVVLGRLRKRELAWATIPASVVAFMLIFYLLGFQAKGSSLLLNRASISFGQTEGEVAQVYSTVSLFSPGRSSYNLRLPDGALAAVEGDRYDYGGDGPAVGGNLYLGQPPEFRDFSIGNWSQRSFSLQAPLRLPAQFAVSDLRDDGTIVTLTVKNAGDRNYRDVVIFSSDNQRSERFDLAPGASRQLTLNESTGDREGLIAYASNGSSGNQYGYYYGDNGNDEDRLRNLRYGLTATLLNSRDFGSTSSPRGVQVYLTAWSDGARGEISLGGTQAQTSLDLYTMPLGVVAK